MNNEIERRFLTTSDYWKTLVNTKQREIIERIEGKTYKIKKITYPNGSTRFELMLKELSNGKEEWHEWLISEELSRCLNFENCSRHLPVISRYFLSWENELTIEISESIDKRTKKPEHVTSTVVFKTVETAEKFKPPEWIGFEITDFLQSSFFIHNY